LAEVEVAAVQQGFLRSCLSDTQDMFHAAEGKEFSSKVDEIIPI
jgi:hypothetical protein